MNNHQKINSIKGILLERWKKSKPTIIIILSILITQACFRLEASNILDKAASITLLSILTIISLVDSSTMLIPVKICNSGIFLGFLYSVLLHDYYKINVVLINLLEHLIACVVIYILFIMINYIGRKILKTESLGHGDAMLMVLGAAWLDIGGTKIAFQIAFLAAALYTSWARAKKKLRPKESFAFGPFISFGIWQAWIYQ
tara:strand:- start:154 stop:756 length:603 start_codon:yes stop_codon:yes gene_type:complete